MPAERRIFGRERRRWWQGWRARRSRAGRQVDASPGRSNGGDTGPDDKSGFWSCWFGFSALRCTSLKLRVIPERFASSRGLAGTLVDRRGFGRQAAAESGFRKGREAYAGHPDRGTVILQARG